MPQRAICFENAVFPVLAAQYFEHKIHQIETWTNRKCFSIKLFQLHWNYCGRQPFFPPIFLFHLTECLIFMSNKSNAVRSKSFFRHLTNWSGFGLKSVVSTIVQRERLLNGLKLTFRQASFSQIFDLKNIVCVDNGFCCTSGLINYQIFWIDNQPTRISATTFHFTVDEFMWQFQNRFWCTNSFCV